MKARCIFGILATIFGSATVLADAGPPRVESVTFDNGQPRIVFSEPMLTWVGSSQPSVISAEPPLPCDWYWENDTRLVCGAGYVVQPMIRQATKYSLRIDGGLWSQQGQEIQATTRDVESSRPDAISATIERWTGDVPVVELNTNVDVTAQALREALRVLSDGAPLDFTLKSVKASYTPKNLTWQITPAQPATPDHLLTIQLAPGLVSTEGPLRGLGSRMLMTARIAEPFRARFAGCNAQPTSGARSSTFDLDANASPMVRCPAGYSVVVELSSAPSAAALEQLKNSVPQGWQFDASNTQRIWMERQKATPWYREGHWIAIKTDHPDQTFDWTLPTSLTSENGATLQREVRLHVQSGDYLPELSARVAYQLLPIGESPPKLITTVNLPQLKFEQHALDGGQPTKWTDTVSNTRRNDIRQLAPPTPPRDVVNGGGLVEGSVVGDAGNPWRHQGSYALNYAAFNVAMSHAGSQFLVWATEWNGATPVANAKVEVLTSKTTTEVETYATATTDNDGIALFDVKTLDPQFPFDAAVRVSANGKRAIVPVGAELFTPRSYPMRLARLVDEGTVIAWGVSDKPIYRPGETVRYRMWVREREANHLRQPAARDATLTLKQRYGSSKVADIRATLDAFGSVTGELALPGTLRDSDYCISLDRRQSDEEGLCFRVTGYHVNDMWAEAKADRSLVREGDTITLDGTAGYYSGGPAVGADGAFSTLLSAQRIESVYPDFDRYTFIDPFDRTNGYGGETLPSFRENNFKTDAHGAVHHAFDSKRPSVDDINAQRPIAFGKLEIAFAAATSGSNSATSAPATMTFSAYARYVGINIEPWTLPVDAKATVDTVVISDAGERQPATDVHIDIEDMSTVTNEGDKPVIVASCTVRSGTPSSCAFHAPHAGEYRFRATSGDAAPAMLTRYIIGTELRVPAKDKLQAQLFTETKQVTAGGVAHIVLQQPFKRAQVLFTIEHGRVLKRWIERMDTPVSTFDVPMPAEWSPGVSVKALVLDAESAAFGQHASKDALVVSAIVDIDIVGAPLPEPLLLSADRAKAKPGDDVAFTLRNPTSQAAQVTLAIVDDGARALVPELEMQTDPNNESWLGALSEWSVTRTAALGHWARNGNRGSARYNPFFRDRPVPAPLYSVRDDVARGQSLETIVVTGSNIPASSMFSRGGAKLKFDVAIPEPNRPAGGGLRSRFVENAMWKTDLVLDANASATTHVRLPDNLTRWRVMAWSADADDAFTLAQTSVEASLPIEVRADVPKRLFAGDVSDVRASVRNHDERARDVAASLHIDGAGVEASVASNKTIASNAQQTIGVTTQPNTDGQMRLEARATSAAGSDGVSATIEVASPLVRQRLPVAGWLPVSGVQFALPSLETGATDEHLAVRIGRGLSAMSQVWSDALRDYPHRCWEQILSRAIGAAAAKKLGIAGNWKDADAAIDEALRVAGQFQDYDGGMHFFSGQSGMFLSQRNTYLTAYTVRGFEFLKSLGYAIPQQIDRNARNAMSGLPHTPNDSNDRWPDTDVVAAIYSGALKNPPDDVWNALWDRRTHLPWFSRADFTVALSKRPTSDTRLPQALEELRDAGRRVGLTRLVASDANARFAFDSNALDQCEVIRALQHVDQSSDAHELSNAYLRGLNDLYAGGNGALDTQASAMCLSMLAEQPASASDNAVVVTAETDAASNTITLAPREASNDWIAPSVPKYLALRPSAATDDIVSFVANIDYAVDGRHAQRAAVGFAIDREYRVLRNGAWKPMAETAICEGDWVRVGLRFTTSAMRHLVAITDVVPGGLRPTDLQLSGVGDLDVKRLSSEGSGYFYEHQIDDHLARFYCEVVPPGVHDIYYYARATHRGHFAALPAVAELMYGKTSVARTAASVVDVADAKNQPADSAARKASAKGAK